MLLSVYEPGSHALFERLFPSVIGLGCSTCVSRVLLVHRLSRVMLLARYPTNNDIGLRRRVDIGRWSARKMEPRSARSRFTRPQGTSRVTPVHNMVHALVIYDLKTSEVMLARDIARLTCGAGKCTQTGCRTAEALNSRHIISGCEGGFWQRAGKTAMCDIHGNSLQQSIVAARDVIPSTKPMTSFRQKEKQEKSGERNNSKCNCRKYNNGEGQIVHGACDKSREIDVKNIINCN